MSEIGASSALAVPLVIGGRTAGVLALAWASARRVPEADVQLTQALAARMARAIENAGLYASELHAHAEVERASDRLRLVSRASELLSESLDYPALFERLARLVVEQLADLCLIDVLDGSDLQRVASAHADPARQPLADRLRAEYPPRLDGEHPVAHVIRTGVAEFSKEMPPGFLRSITRDDEHLRIASELGFQSFMCAPLSARGRILGTITFVSCHPDRRYDESDLSLAMDIARTAAVRIDNARLFHERDHVARSLQQILLPESLLDIPGFELAAMYRPGREGMEVGGDFYDVFIRPDGSFGIAIGDVCGHGPEAAAVMGVARRTIRVAGMNETRPSAILGVLNEALRRGGYERFVTVCDVRVLPTDGTARLTICAAGHPLPVLVRADGEVHVAGRHGTVLGIVEDVRLTDVAVQMGPGDALVMYTDGLIEWPSHEDVDRSFSDLLSSLAGRSAADITDGLQAWWSDGTGGRSRDDAAVIVLRAACDPPARGGSA